MKAMFIAKIEHLPAVQEWVLDQLHLMEFEPSILRKIELVLEEVFVNIVQHAYQGNPENIEIQVRALPEKYVEIIFKDYGPPFNPLDIKERESSLGLEDLPIGGLGIPFIRKLMDQVHYSREGGLNTLVLVKKAATHPS